MGKHSNLLICALLVAVTFGLYWQVTGFDFTHYDDNLYVSDNPSVQAGLSASSVWWALSAPHYATYQPVVWLSFMADSDVGRLIGWTTGADAGQCSPGYYHVVNALIHAANVILLFLLLNAMTCCRVRSACVAALFAVHPLHVESVAWIVERKDVLSTFFCFLAILAYVGYVRTPGVSRYLLVAAAFLLGLLSKPMLVTLPLVLLLLDVWPLGRVDFSVDSRPVMRSAMVLLREKLPLFAMALAAAALAFVAQQSGGAIGSLTKYPLGVRMANAAVSYVSYLWKTIWPTELMIPYPHPGASLPVWHTILALALLVSVTLVAVRLVRHAPYVTIGWLWYVISLLPVSGIVQFGMQAMADRFTYVPHVGLFVTVVWGGAELLQWISTGKRTVLSGLLRPGVVAAMVLIPFALSVLTHRQLGYWRNDFTLFGHTLSLNRENAVAHYNLGTSFLAAGAPEKAEAHYRAALCTDPNLEGPDTNLAYLLIEQSRIDEAIAHLRRAVAINPGNADRHANLARALVMKGQVDAAIGEFSRALRIAPDDSALRAEFDEVRSLVTH